MNKEVIIICETIYNGNTMRLAKAMAFTLNCEIVSSHEALNMNLSPYKLVGFGSGIYFTSHHPSLIKVVDRLNDTQKAFVFSTHGAPFLCKYHDTINKKLAKNNIEVIGEFSSKGYDCTGPFIIVNGVNMGRPNEKDEQNASRFIAKLLPTYVKKLNDVPKGHLIQVNNECIGCGKCKLICPMNVFVFKENRSIPVDEQECIHCCLCQKSCPKQAISIKHSFINAIMIAKKHSKKKSI